MALISVIRPSTLTAAAFAVALLALVAEPVEAQRQRVGIHVGNAVLAGEFEDLQGDTVYLRVSLHDQRRVPLGTIFMMDFTDERLAPTREEVDEANDGLTGGALRWHLLVLRSGARVKGRLLAIEGGPGSAKADELRIVTFGGADGHIRQYEATDVARIYMRHMTLRDTAAPASGGGAVTVPANVRWVSTGLVVRAGETIEFTTRGEVDIAGDGSDTGGVDGSVMGSRSSRATMPNELQGALVGRVGDGEPFGIGSQPRLVMPAAGELFLGVNDDNHADNRGGFTVTVRRVP